MNNDEHRKLEASLRQIKILITVAVCLLLLIALTLLPRILEALLIGIMILAVPAMFFVTTFVLECLSPSRPRTPTDESTDEY